MIKIVLYNNLTKKYIMRKTLLFAGTLLFSLIAQAQNFHIEEANNPNDIYLSGDIVEVGELEDVITGAGRFKFKVRNNSEDVIHVRAKLVEVLNGKPDEERQNLDFCFAVMCYDKITLGTVYPTGGQYAEIEPDDTHKDNDTDYITNYYEPADGGVVDYTFRFFEVNDDLEEIGDPLLLTYRYNPTLSTPDFNADFALLKSTILKDVMELELESDATLSMYDMSGREVLNRNLTSGAHHVALPSLSSNMYFIQLSNREGAKQTFKVIVK